MMIMAKLAEFLPQHNIGQAWITLPLNILQCTIGLDVYDATEYYIDTIMEPKWYALK